MTMIMRFCTEVSIFFRVIDWLIDWFSWVEQADRDSEADSWDSSLHQCFDGDCSSALWCSSDDEPYRRRQASEASFVAVAVQSSAQ